MSQTNTLAYKLGECQFERCISMKVSDKNNMKAVPPLYTKPFAKSRMAL